ncbi:hypothetical protein HAX54_010061, partial [Datura stramonium]|nr:hypothetical protein [Datura stramonium]
MESWSDAVFPDPASVSVKLLDPLNGIVNQFSLPEMHLQSNGVRQERNARKKKYGLTSLSCNASMHTGGRSCLLRGYILSILLANLKENQATKPTPKARKIKVEVGGASRIVSTRLFRVLLRFGARFWAKKLKVDTPILAKITSSK